MQNQRKTNRQFKEVRIAIIPECALSFFGSVWVNVRCDGSSVRDQKKNTRELSLILSDQKYNNNCCDAPNTYWNDNCIMNTTNHCHNTGAAAATSICIIGGCHNANILMHPVTDSYDAGGDDGGDYGGCDGGGDGGGGDF